jgi:hypothetical protein
MVRLTGLIVCGALSVRQTMRLAASHCSRHVTSKVTSNAIKNPP